MRTCSVPGCDRPHYGHGYCNMHWLRWRRTGDPLIVRPPMANSGSFQKGQPSPNKGVPMSEEAKQHLREVKTGRSMPTNPTRFQPGQVPHNKGKSWSEGTKKKIRVARARQVLPLDHGLKVRRALTGKPKTPEHIAKLSGPNHYRWNGGHGRNLSKREWRELRQQVLERDNYTCQQCGATDVVLVAHHIIPHPDGPDAFDNLVSWCRACHVRYHSLNP